MRIGIATGLVVVASAEKGAVGETMNLASRLQDIAQPGDIVASERVHRLAHPCLPHRKDERGEQPFRGRHPGRASSSGGTRTGVRSTDGTLGAGPGRRRAGSAAFGGVNGGVNPTLNGGVASGNAAQR